MGQISDKIINNNKNTYKYVLHSPKTVDLVRREEIKNKRKEDRDRKEQS